MTLPATSEPTFSPFCPHSLPPPSSRHESHPKEASGGPVSDPLSGSDQCLATLAFPSTTWSSCPSPQRTTPRPGSGPGSGLGSGPGPEPGPGPGLTLSASVARLESHRWPVLPPISPVRGEECPRWSVHSLLLLLPPLLPSTFFA